MGELTTHARHALSEPLAGGPRHAVAVVLSSDAVADQLGLFDRKPQPAPPEPIRTPEPPEPKPAVVVPPVDARQSDLFGDRTLGAAAVQRALFDFDLVAATEALRELVVRYPEDPALRERAGAIASLAASLERGRAASPSQARALLTIGKLVPANLEAAWLRRIASTIESELGTGATLDGTPAGAYWLRADEAARAEASLRETLVREPNDAHARGYLGDALFAQGRGELARNEYRDALADAPGDVDLARMLDREVADLPASAELEYEVPGPPHEWSAATGVLDGLFMAPRRVPEGWTEPAALESLAPGIRFYRWLVRETSASSDAERIACRRAIGVPPVLWTFPEA